MKLPLKSKVLLCHLWVLKIYGYSHRKCIFGCEKRVLRRLFREDCLEIFIQTRESVYVPYGVCCSYGKGDSLTVSDGFAASQFSVSLDANKIALCFETMKNMVISEREKTLNSQAVYFSSMSDDVLVFEIGLNREQFQYLLQFVKDGQLHVRSAEFALGVYLSRLRWAYTYNKLALRWRITRQTVSSNCEEIRQVLSKLVLIPFSGFRSSSIDFPSDKSC